MIDGEVPKSNPYPYKIYCGIWIQGTVDGNDVLVNRFSGITSFVSPIGHYLKYLQVDPDLPDEEKWNQAVSAWK